MSSLVSSFRAAVISHCRDLTKDDAGPSKLITTIDDGGESIVTPSKKPKVELSKCPYLQVSPIALASTEDVGTSEVKMSVELTLWSTGWGLEVGDRFLSLAFSSVCRALRRPPYSYRDVKLVGSSPVRQYLMNPDGSEGPPITETKCTLSTVVCTLN